jgi:DNA-binding response OmpR family regulator
MARILFAEDDIVFGSSLVEYLVSLGHKVVWEKDGKAALGHTSGKFDIFIFDIDMPIMDGYELLKAIRAKKNSTPCLYLTAKDDTESLTKGFKAGANDYLKKPFDLVELDMRIYAMIETKEHKNTKELTYKNYKYDTELNLLYKAGKPISLSKKQSEVINILFKQKSLAIGFDDMSRNLEKNTSDKYLLSIITLINKTTKLKIATKNGVIFLP